MGSHSLLQGIFTTQELNPGLLHCRQILYCLSHQGSPVTLMSMPAVKGGRDWVHSALSTVPQTIVRAGQMQLYESKSGE